MNVFNGQRRTHWGRFEVKKEVRWSWIRYLQVKQRSQTYFAHYGKRAWNYYRRSQKGLRSYWGNIWQVIRNSMRILDH